MQSHACIGKYCIASWIADDRQSFRDCGLLVLDCVFGIVLQTVFFSGLQEGLRKGSGWDCLDCESIVLVGARAI